MGYILGFVQNIEDNYLAYLGGWLGDATITDDATGLTTFGNDDYCADLDAENVFRRINDGETSITALNTYYNLLASGSNRATIFLGHIPYSTVANMIFARFGLYLSEAENLEALQTQQPDTYNFLRSLDDELTEIEDYT